MAIQKVNSQQYRELVFKSAKQPIIRSLPTRPDSNVIRQNRPTKKTAKTTSKPKHQSIDHQFLPFEQKVKLKAQMLVVHLQWGAGATEKMSEMIKQALDKPCPYCGWAMDLARITADHKTPLLRSKKFAKLQRRSWDHKQLNDQSNIHIICTDCNKIKREMTHEQMVKLMQFLNDNLDIKEHILKRLQASNAAYAWARMKRKA